MLWWIAGDTSCACNDALARKADSAALAAAIQEHDFSRFTKIRCCYSSSSGVAGAHIPVCEAEGTLQQDHVVHSALIELALAQQEPEVLAEDLDAIKAGLPPDVAHHACTVQQAADCDC